MQTQRTLFWCFVASVVVLVVLALATVAMGDAPEYPFKNVQQLGPGIPGWETQGTPRPDPSLTCLGHPIFIFQHKGEGTVGWQTWVRAKGPDLTAAYFRDVTVEDQASPVHVIFGTVNLDNGRITIIRSEPYDPAAHKAPCQDWK